MSSIAKALGQKPVMWEPGLESPPEMRGLKAMRDVGSGFSTGQLGASLALALGSRAVPALQELGESGALFPENPNIPPGLRKADLYTPAEESYANFENAYNKHMNNYDFEKAIEDKWGMLRHTGGN